LITSSVSVFLEGRLYATAHTLSQVRTARGAVHMVEDPVQRHVDQIRMDVHMMT